MGEGVVLLVTGSFPLSLAEGLEAGLGASAEAAARSGVVEVYMLGQREGGKTKGAWGTTHVGRRGTTEGDGFS